MAFEVVITIILISVAAYSLYSSFRKKASGECSCCSDGKAKRKVSE